MAAFAYRPPMLRQPQPLVSLPAGDGSECSSPVAPAAARGRLSALALSLDSAAPVRASCAALPAVALAYCAWRNARRRARSRTWRAAIGIESEQDLASFIQPGRRKAAKSTLVRTPVDVVDAAAEDDLASFIQPGRPKADKKAPARTPAAASDTADEDDLASFIQPGRAKPSKRGAARTLAEEVDVEKQDNGAREAEEPGLNPRMVNEYVRTREDDDDDDDDESSKRGQYKRMFQEMWRKKDIEAEEQGFEMREGIRPSHVAFESAQVSARTMDESVPNLNDLAEVAGGVLIRNENNGIRRRSDGDEAREAQGLIERPEDMDEGDELKPIFARRRNRKDVKSRREMYLKGRDKPSADMNAPSAASLIPATGTVRDQIAADQEQNPGRWHTMSNAAGLRARLEKIRRVRNVDSNGDPLSVNGEFGDPLDAIARKGLSLEDIQVQNYEAREAAKREAAAAGVVISEDVEMNEGLKAFMALDEVERADLIDHRTREALRYVQEGDMSKASELFAEVKQITSVFKSLHEPEEPEEKEDQLDAVEKLWYKMQTEMHKEDFAAIFGSKATNNHMIGSPMT